MGSESGYDIDTKSEGHNYRFHVHHITYPYTTIRCFQNYGEAEAFIWGLENMAERHSLEGWAPRETETDKVTGLSLIENKSGAWKVLDRKGNMVGIFENKESANLWSDGVRHGMEMAQEIVLNRLATVLDLSFSGEFVITKPE